MAKGTFADGSLGTSDGEIIWDDPSGSSIITRVFIRERERQMRQRRCDARTRENMRPLLKGGHGPRNAGSL